MGGAIGEINKEGFVLLFLDVVHGAVGEIVYDETFAGDDLAVVFEHGRVVLPPMAGAESVVFINAPGVGVVGRLHAVMPFPECSGIVTGGLEGLEDGGFVEVHALFTSTGRADAGAGIVAAGHELRSGGGADGADVESFQLHALGGEPINVGRADVGIAVDAEIAPALIVGENDDDVGAFGGGQ